MQKEKRVKMQTMFFEECANTGRYVNVMNTAKNMRAGLYFAAATPEGESHNKY